MGRPIPVSTASKSVRKYRDGVIAAMRRAMRASSETWPKPGKVHLAMALDLFFETSDRDRWGKPHTTRPDSDNVAKLWMDCAQKAGLIHDDSQIAELIVRKKWSETAGAVLSLSDGSSTLNATSDDNDDIGADEI